MAKACKKWDVACQGDTCVFGDFVQAGVYTSMREPSFAVPGELQLVEKKINSGNPAVPGNYEISTSVFRGFTRSARYPLDPPAIAHFLRLGYGLISKVRVSSLYRACGSIDLVAASVDASLGIVEHAIFGEDLIDGRAPTRGVVFTEDIAKVAG